MIPSFAKKQQTEKTFVIGAIGLKDMEVDSFKRLFSITRVRSRDYDIRVINDTKSFDYSDVDMIVVDGRGQQSIQEWRSASRQAGDLARRPVIFVTSPRNPQALKGYHISIPFNPSRVLKVLDSFTIKELDYLPEFEIGSEDSVQTNAQEGIKLLHSNKSRKDNGINALVVDDSLAVRKQLEIEFGLLNINVDMAADGYAAGQKIQEKKYDIIYLDVVMEGEDGYAVCKRIRNNVINKNTPVVLLTSRSSTVDKLKGTLAGCNSYLTKPISHSEFIQETKKFVDLSNLSKEEVQ